MSRNVLMIFNTSNYMPQLQASIVKPVSSKQARNELMESHATVHHTRIRYLRINNVQLEVDFTGVVL